VPSCRDREEQQRVSQLYRNFVDRNRTLEEVTALGAEEACEENGNGDDNE